MKWLKREWIATATASPGRTTATPAPGWRSSRPLARTARIDVVPPWSTAVPKPLTIQRKTLALPEGAQVLHVLDEREAGAHREAEDRRVDEEADPLPREEVEHRQRLQQLLGDGRDVARERPAGDPARVQEPPVQPRPDEGRHGARQDQPDDRPERDQLEAVHQDEHAQKHEDRHERERRR